MRGVKFYFINELLFVVFIQLISTSAYADYSCSGFVDNAILKIKNVVCYWKQSNLEKLKLRLDDYEKQLSDEVEHYDANDPNWEKNSNKKIKNMLPSIKEIRCLNFFANYELAKCKGSSLPVDKYRCVEKPDITYPAFSASFKNKHCYQANNQHILNENRRDKLSFVNEPNTEAKLQADLSKGKESEDNLQFLCDLLKTD